jgi:pimeloyl-ACP methyl ester carboxylesterase
MPVARLFFRAVGFPTDISDEAVTTAIHCVAAVDFGTVRRDLAHVVCPCLVAHAEDDPLVDAALADEIGAAVPPGARLRFDDGGHRIHKAYAVEIAEALRPLVIDRRPQSPDTDRRAAARASTPG